MWRRFMYWRSPRHPLAHSCMSRVVRRRSVKLPKPSQPGLVLAPRNLGLPRKQLRLGDGVWRCFHSAPTVVCAAKLRRGFAGHPLQDPARTWIPTESVSALVTPRKLRLLDSASGYPADEPIEKKIVRDRHRNARDQRRAHQLAPVEDVAAD